MTQQTDKFNKELISKVIRIQVELDEIKSQIGLINNQNLKEEMKLWEETGAEDSEEFFERNNL